MYIQGSEEKERRENVIYIKLYKYDDDDDNDGGGGGGVGEIPFIYTPCDDETTSVLCRGLSAR